MQHQSDRKKAPYKIVRLNFCTSLLHNIREIWGGVEFLGATIEYIDPEWSPGIVRICIFLFKKNERSIFFVCLLLTTQKRDSVKKLEVICPRFERQVNDYDIVSSDS